MTEDVVVRIREFMLSRRMKLTQFARELDVDYNHLHNQFKSGKVSETVLIKMALIYEDVDMNYILRGKPMKVGFKWL